MSGLRIMRQEDDSNPPAVINEVLNDDFFSKLKMERIPLLLMNYTREEADYQGLCPDRSDTIANEIIVRYQVTQRDRQASKEEIRVNLIGVYVHECAHRLSNQHHYGGFLAVNIFLLLRLDEPRVMHRYISLYEQHEETEYHPADTLKFAWDIAHELAPTDLTAEAATEIILDKYKAWCKWMDGAEAREQDAQTREIGTTALIGKLKAGRKSMAAEINSLKTQCWHFFACGVVFTSVIAYFLK